jgi:hypothetical protein
VNIALSRSSIRHRGAALAATAGSGQTKRARRRPVSVLAVSALAVASGIAGCGGSSDHRVAAKSPGASVPAAANATPTVKSVPLSSPANSIDVAGSGVGSTDNGVAAESPDAILAAAVSSARELKSVRVTGSVVSGGSALAFDLNLAAGEGGEGQLSQAGLGFRMIVIKDEVFINASDAFWRHFGRAAAAQLFDGRWLKGPATGQFAGVARLTDVQSLFSAFLSGHGKLAKGRLSMVAGQKVIAVNDTTHGGTLYVATTGEPYPIEIAKAGSGGGRVVFDRYNQPVSLSAPANAIDLTKLQAAGATQQPSNPAIVVLGAKGFAPGGDGFGTVQPADIYNGGDPSGHVSQIRWAGWGSNTAFGTGMSWIFKPSGGYYPQPVVVQLRADRLASCAPGGPSAYRRLSVREPSVPGGPLGPWVDWSGGNICSFPSG